MVQLKKQYHLTVDSLAKQWTFLGWSSALSNNSCTAWDTLPCIAIFQGSMLMSEFWQTDASLVPEAWIFGTGTLGDALGYRKLCMEGTSWYKADLADKTSTALLWEARPASTQSNQIFAEGGEWKDARLEAVSCGERLEPTKSERALRMLPRTSLDSNRALSNGLCSFQGVSFQCGRMSFLLTPPNKQTRTTTTLRTKTSILSEGGSY